MSNEYSRKDKSLLLCSFVAQKWIHSFRRSPYSTYIIFSISFEFLFAAHDAFVKVGRLLQARRKTDLYETVTHFTANAKDPATSDATLMAKLKENCKKQKKISDILEKWV